MAGIYIPNLGLPEDEQLIVITVAGIAMLVGPEVTKLRAEQVVPVPDHGDLIDRGALIYAYDDEHIGPPGRARYLMEAAPAIIPADPADKEVE